MIKISNNNVDKTPQKHDRGYKNLFEDKENFIHFLKKYVNKPWTKNINIEDLELVDDSFILDNFGKLESDIIYRLKINGQDVYFYVLLELQSEVDFTMPIRVFRYISSILVRVFNNENQNTREQKGFKLPAVVPIVLYNGKDNWTAALEFKDYTQNGELFEDNIINFKYILFDLNRQNESFISSTNTLVDCVFSFDYNSRNYDLSETVERIETISNELSNDDLGKFLRWLLYIFFDGVLPVEVEKLIGELAKSKKEESNMTHAIERWLFKERQDSWLTGKLEGRQEGKLEGKLEGIKEGATKIAINLFNRNMPIDFIAQTTGLSEEEIKSLI